MTISPVCYLYLCNPQSLVEVIVFLTPSPEVVRQAIHLQWMDTWVMKQNHHVPLSGHTLSINECTLEFGGIFRVCILFVCKYFIVIIKQ